MALATMGTNFIMCFLTSFMMVSHPIRRPNSAFRLLSLESKSIQFRLKLDIFEVTIFDQGVLTNENLLNCI